MAQDTTHTITFTAPVLSYAPIEYAPAYFNQYNDSLRLYFSRIDNAFRDRSSEEYSESVAWFMG
mgnify:FL=1|jgi:hypothetical protein